MLLDQLSHQEIALLFATRCSANAQTAAELARNSETSEVSARRPLDLLVQKGILEPYMQEWDDTTRYMYSGSEYAQKVYDAIHGPFLE